MGLCHFNNTRKFLTLLNNDVNGGVVLTFEFFVVFVSCVWSGNVS
jgi:hypothetical protein